MNFKRPRDPNTPRPKPLRLVAPSENIVCQVGMGECPNIAVESQSDGAGGEFFLCAQHAKEFGDLAVLIDEMTPDQVNAFSEAVLKAERA